MRIITGSQPPVNAHPSIFSAMSLKPLFPDEPPFMLGSNRLPPPRRKPSFALAWGLTLALMVLVATASWVFSLYVFGHPEKPSNYKLLAKLGRMAPPKRFTSHDVPGGKPLAARDAYAKYRKFAALQEEEKKALNDKLIREYVTNYRRADTVDYLSGMFRIVDVRALGEGTLMSAGLVLRARSTEIEDLLVEYLMPGESPKPDQFRPGDDLFLDATSAFGAIIHFEALQGDELVLTVVPLVYGEHSTPSGGRITLDPPERLKLDAPWPVSAGVPLPPP